MDLIEKLTIDTPENVALEFPLAGIGSRFLAIICDTLIQVVLYIVLVLVVYVAIPSQLQWASVDKWLTAAMIIAIFCLYWGYFAFFETIWKGQTPGKRLVKIRVIKDTGRAITPFEAVARNLLRAIDQFPGIYAVGVLTAFLNKDNRRLGDFVAGTIVVHERKAQDAESIWSIPSEAAARSIDVSTLSERDLEVIEAFLGRRLDMPLDVRQQTARKLADVFAARLNVPAETRGSNEDLLESVALNIRNSARYRNR